MSGLCPKDREYLDKYAGRIPTDLRTRNNVVDDMVPQMLEEITELEA